MPEQMFERAIRLPLGYVVTARARPSTVRRAVVRLLPWAVYAAMPKGRRADIALSVARRLSPLVRQR